MMTRDQIRSSLIASLALFVWITQSTRSPASARDLTLEERVSAQTAIEQVYWAHRIWPRENTGAKPALEAVLPLPAIRARVEDYLQRSNALEKFWGRVITKEQLQAELDRMAHDSRQPEILREILAALGDDPFLAAECLARPALVDRLIRSWYARDDRFHGALRQKISAALGADATAEELEATGGRLRVVMRKRLDTESPARESVERLTGREAAIESHELVSDEDDILDAEQWNAFEVSLAEFDPSTLAGSSTNPSPLAGRPADPSPLVGRSTNPSLLADRPTDPSWLAGSSSERHAEAAGTEVPPATRAMAEPLTLGRFGRLEEGEDSFSTTAILSRTEDAIRIATVSWAKQSFDAWWHQARASVPRSLIVPEGSYTLLAPATTTCVEDSWSQTLEFAPVNRKEDNAVWTGSEMLVWGGEFDHGNVTGPQKSTENTGFRYDPATDIWTVMGIGGQLPQARRGHTAVWTGTEMIVWGGQSNASAPGANPPLRINTGGRYNPLTDTWTATSLASGVPAARISHTAVWTGSRMIIWGGSVFGGVSNTGARYDPGSDSWLATSTVSAPSPREANATVWSGTEMIVWGGVTNDPSGGRYNPSTNTWIPTSIDENTPAWRLDPVAVWTGSVMIVWGGSQGSNSLNSGGRYNPSTNTWAPTSVGAGVPAQQKNPTVLWTGSNMILWGGAGWLGPEQHRRRV